jgi:hypothetical protein
VNGKVQLIVSAALLLAGLGAVVQARALPPDDKQAADTQASQAQSTSGSPVAVPPKITYEGGQLTIVAENSMLSDVMNALHTVLGANVELPANVSTERVWARLGPGPARKVLSDLLSGTDLDFVIQGSATDADGIRSVLLTPHAESTPGTPGPGPSPDTPARMAMRRFQGARPETEPQENPAPPETPATPAATDSTPAPAPSAPLATTTPTAGESASATGDVTAHPSPPASPTQENISQQLLSMYEQRRQLNQRGAQPPPLQTAPPQ